MRNKALKILSLFLAVALVTVSCLTYAFADTTGSITVNVVYNDKPVSSGVFTIYKIADINSDGSYTYTSDFAGYGSSITDLSDSTLPWLLWSWANQTGVTGSSMTVGTKGTVTFTDLETGVYLVVPSTNPSGYEAEPSIVPIPYDGDYDVEIDVKLEPSYTPPDTPPGTPTTTVTTVVSVPEVEITTDGENEEPGDVDVEIDKPEPEENEPEEQPTEEEETLPQTGQLNYPIPIMAGAGAICVAAGLIVTKTDKSDKKK